MATGPGCRATYRVSAAVMERDWLAPALTYDQIAELADLIIEHRSEAPFEIARHILLGGWVRDSAAEDGCNDAAGSKVAQVRSGLDLPDQSQSNSVREAND